MFLSVAELAPFNTEIIDHPGKTYQVAQTRETRETKSASAASAAPLSMAGL
ncbi:MAG: hypothetical protein WDN46_15170 [Methylocella sp.]